MLRATATGGFRLFADVQFLRVTGRNRPLPVTHSTGGGRQLRGVYRSLDVLYSSLIATKGRKIVYQDVRLWNRIRRRILENGESIHHVSKTTLISRPTIRKMLKHEKPVPHIRRMGQVIHESKKRDTPPALCRQEQVKREWMEWLYCLERNPSEIVGNSLTPPDLLDQLSPSPHSLRKRALAILARRNGFSFHAICEHLGICRNTIKGYIADFDAAGAIRLHQPVQRKRKSDDEGLKRAVFALLHEPPSLSGYNRTTWRMEDLQQALKAKGFARTSRPSNCRGTWRSRP